MAYRIEVSADAKKQLERLDFGTRERLMRFMMERLPRLEDPRSLGEALKGTELGELWRYRVGDYRILCRIEDELVLVLVLRIGHRREVYR
ncbi:MAG TPA: type II toxin-antitoxin system RelE/ParE family toxin [Rectinemataceae bacterium]|nr:type II toxin-antitoxin system RelE/ParE family toxin [Rectinemataceae bacterium]